MIDDQTPHRPLPAPSPTPTLREKASAMAEIVLEGAYTKAVDDDTPIKTKMEFIELCAKLGDLNPKPQQNTQFGTGFQINIVFDGENPQKTVNTFTHIPPAVQIPPEDAEILPQTPPQALYSPADACVFNLDLMVSEDLVCDYA